MHVYNTLSFIRSCNIFVYLSQSTVDFSMELGPTGLTLKTKISELAIFATRVSNLFNRATKVSSHAWYNYMYTLVYDYAVACMITFARYSLGTKAPISKEVGAFVYSYNYV